MAASAGRLRLSKFTAGTERAIGIRSYHPVRPLTTQTRPTAPAWMLPSFLATANIHTAFCCGPRSASSFRQSSLWCSSWKPIRASFSTHSSSMEGNTTQEDDTTVSAAMPKHQIRLSKLLSHHSQSLAISRREAERLIRGGSVTVAGQYITSPHYLVDWDDLQTSQTPGIVKVDGKAVALVPPRSSSSAKHYNASFSDDNHHEEEEPKIWIVHKLKGEVVADHDPQGRPSMMERLMRGGVGRINKQRRYHLKPIGRLDMMTEGLILVTTSGRYAREMELPVYEFHRTYRVRVHGPLTQYKILAMQKGLRMEDEHSGKVIRFAPMKVEVEGSSNKQQRRSANCWIRMTCTEGKNRQIRNVLKHLGLSVTRLIRTSFGDYQLQTIPSGMALEVPLKELKKQIHKGPLFKKNTQKKAKKQQRQQVDEEASPVKWVRHYR